MMERRTFGADSTLGSDYLVQYVCGSISTPGWLYHLDPVHPIEPGESWEQALLRYGYDAKPVLLLGAPDRGMEVRIYCTTGRLPVGYLAAIDGPLVPEGQPPIGVGLMDWS